jgi:hypothetical protein
MDRYKNAGYSSGSPPVIPERELLEWLASFSPRHEAELRRLRWAEAEAEAKKRHERELLEWLASISEKHDRELQALLRQEAEERETRERSQRLAEDPTTVAEWDEADHPRERKGTPGGGQWVAKDGSGGASTGEPPDTQSDERAPPQDPKVKHLRDFDKAHNLTLPDALKDGKLSVGDIARIKFTDDEIKQILKSAEKPGSELNLNFYTAQNLTPRLRAKAEEKFADLPGDEKYAMQAFISNQNRARTILMARDPAFQQYVGELYGFLRSLNPTHFLVEKGVVVAIGKEPVLGGDASRLDALKDMLIYVAIMKGVSWGIGKTTSILVGPESTGEITIAFKGGGKVTIRRGAEYSPNTLEDAVERAAAGEKVEINPPAPKPPRPSLTEVSSVTDNPNAFRRWFNELTPEEFQTVWKNPKLRDLVEKGLRWPGRQHEWLMVGRAPKFKEWGLTAEQIAEMRTPISKIRFKNPPGGHEGEGATTAHNQILKIIDSSPDFATYKTRLQGWANDRLEGGADALPPGLRP